MPNPFRYYGSVRYSILAEKKYCGGQRHGSATSMFFKKYYCGPRHSTMSGATVIRFFIEVALLCLWPQ